MFSQILYGGDYNPEQWAEEIWDEDVSLMREAGVNTATAAVFAWVTLQPAEDTYQFAWLDRVVAKLHAGGIGVCLATATASVPAWMDRAYPDVRRTDINGRKLKHGGRHSFCPNSPNFRRLAASLVTRLAERYVSHPAVIAWHVSNEYGSPCYCDLCAAGFLVWLQARYGSLASVNRAWHSIFWGHTFTEWAEIETPTLDGDRSMPSLLVDYDRFQSDSLLACYKAERDILRAGGALQPITTNLMGTFKSLNYQHWAREMDIIGMRVRPLASAKGI